MKKVIYVLVAVATLAFVGCSKDDDATPTPENIAGSWEVYKAYWEEEFEEEGEKVSEKYWEHYDAGEEIYTFEANGIFSLSMGSDWYGNNHAGTYTINGKTLTLVYSPSADIGTKIYTIKSLLANELVLIEKDEGDDYKAYGEIYLKRIK